MFLFFSIWLICLLLACAHDIVKLLHLGKLLTSSNNGAQNKELREEYEKAKANLEAVKIAPSSGEYALMVKTMRAEQKIKDIQEKMQGTNNMSRIKVASYELIGGYVLKAFLSLVLLGFSIFYRYSPVLVYDERFNFTPIEGLISFPTGVPNAVSVPVWVLACNMSFRTIVSFIKRKK